MSRPVPDFLALDIAAHVQAATPGLWFDGSTAAGRMASAWAKLQRIRILKLRGLMR